MASKMLKFIGWDLKQPINSLDCLWMLDYNKHKSNVRPTTSQFKDAELIIDPEGTIKRLGYDWDAIDAQMKAYYASTAPCNPNPVSITLTGLPPGTIGFASQPGTLTLGDEYKPDWAFKPECYHEWIKYTGLQEQYEYCKKCDQKK